MNIKSYPALRKAEFPNGTRCSYTGCPNFIMPRQPYDEIVISVEEDAVTVNIVCVYH